MGEPLSVVIKAEEPKKVIGVSFDKGTHVLAEGLIFLQDLFVSNRSEDYAQIMIEDKGKEIMLVEVKPHDTAFFNYQKTLFWGKLKIVSTGKVFVTLGIVICKNG